MDAFEWPREAGPIAERNPLVPTGPSVEIPAGSIVRTVAASSDQVPLAHEGRVPQIYSTVTVDIDRPFLVIRQDRDLAAPLGTILYPVVRDNYGTRELRDFSILPPDPTSASLFGTRKDGIRNTDFIPLADVLRLSKDMVNLGVELRGREIHFWRAGEEVPAETAIPQLLEAFSAANVPAPLLRSKEYSKITGDGAVKLDASGIVCDTVAEVLQIYWRFLNDRGYQVQGEADLMYTAGDDLGDSARDFILDALEPLAAFRDKAAQQSGSFSYLHQIADAIEHGMTVEDPAYDRAHFYQHWDNVDGLGTPFLGYTLHGEAVGDKLVFSISRGGTDRTAEESLAASLGKERRIRGMSMTAQIDRDSTDWCGINLASIFGGTGIDPELLAGDTASRLVGIEEYQVTVDIRGAAFDVSLRFGTDPYNTISPWLVGGSRLYMHSEEPVQLTLALRPKNNGVLISKDQKEGIEALLLVIHERLLAQR